MARYKVPQDVEADDKLLGPFSFRQFIYLIIAALGIAIAWGLSRLFIPLAVIPMPIILLFGALALPLRKDQPMEIYLAAILAFYLKPRKRLWVPDGVQSLVEIVTPKVVEVQRAKDLSQSEAEQRLSYLADIADTRGWSVRGVAPQPVSSMNPDIYYEAQQTTDVMDDSGAVGQSFDRMITAADTKRREDMMERMHQQATAPQPPKQAQTFTPTPIADPYANLTAPTYNPYPAMHQSMIDPNGNRASQIAQAAAPQPSAQPEHTSVPAQTANITTSEKPISADIISLANNSDLSVETIAREAHRIEQKEQKLNDDEVVISLH